MWIAEGEKYALVGLTVELEGEPPPDKIAPGLWIFSDKTFDVPTLWREWLGSIRVEEVEASNLLLVSKMASDTPDILDAENQALQKTVWNFYVGLLLSSTFSPSYSPVMLTGVRQRDEISIRQKGDLDCPQPQKICPYPPIISDDILRSVAVGQGLCAMVLGPVPGGLWRFFRTLDIYVRARSNPNCLDRIHQYCRCIDGLILPAPGKTTQQFRSRTELFIGPKHHELMGKLYEIRSKVEHLHENQYLGAFDRKVRLDLVEKEAIVENIARTALERIVSNDALWAHFGNSEALAAFWALPPEQRAEIWGDTIDPLAPLEGYDPSRLNDGVLGAR